MNWQSADLLQCEEVSSAHLILHRRNSSVCSLYENWTQSISISGKAMSGEKKATNQKTTTKKPSNFLTHRNNFLVSNFLKLVKN